MAITINQQPDIYTPVYNPMRFVLTSTNTAQDNFKYVADVYVSGVTGYTRLTYDSDPNNGGRCAADVSRVLESYVTKDVNHSTYGFTRASNSYCAYEVKFGEQYGASGSVVTYTDLTVTGLKYAWNGVLSSNTFQNYSYSGYTIGGGSALLTARANQQYFYNTTDDSLIHFINDTSGSAYYCLVKTYDESNNLLGTYQITNSYQASASYTDKLLYLNVGSDGINNALSPVIAIDATVDHYTVVITDFFGSETSETYTYTKLCSWKGYSPVNVFFMNRLGGYDNFPFQLKRIITSESKRDTYQKNLGSLNNTTWTYTTQDRGTTVMNNEITDKYQLTSNWLSNSESNWLQELIESPDVYIWQGATLIPVVVKNTSYEIKSTGQEKLFNLTLDLEYANKRATQRA